MAQQGHSGSTAWGWRHAIAKSGLPAETRHVLLTLSLWMNEMGEGCFPSIATLVEATGRDKKTVRKHLDLAHEKGWLVVSRLGLGGQKWRQKEYKARWPERDIETTTSSEGGGAVPPPSDDEKVGETAPEGGGTGSRKVGEQVPQDNTSPVDSSNTSPSERESACAPADDGRKGTQDVDRADTPGTADFAKRVQRLCAGTGYLTGRWPDWDQVTIGYLEKQFAALSSEERLEMERWRDPVLADFEARKRKPPPLGPFMAHRQWQALEPAILDRFEKIKAARLPAAERPKPDGWAACMGPVGMAWLFDKLLAGPAEDPGKEPLFVASVLRRCWPAVAEWQQVQQQRGGLAFGPRWHDLKDCMEPVPPGDTLDAWRAEFGARRWPWPSAFDRAEVVYCPKGGPDGLGEFGQRLAEGNTTQEAAE